MPPIARSQGHRSQSYSRLERLLLDKLVGLAMGIVRTVAAVVGLAAIVRNKAHGVPLLDEVGVLVYELCSSASASGQRI